ncbi:MAG: alanine racemase [Armatimonadetes bacterium]|nr:alanine racemase [Armatimonadota bacterium]
MVPYPRTWIEVDLPALRQNLSLVRENIGPDVLIALVAKADAYGHGLVPVCRYAAHHGADWIAVATVQEGIALRDAGLSLPILVLSPILEVEAEQAVFYDLRVMVERIELAQELDQAAKNQNRIARIHIPVDTGVSRFGCTPEEACGLLESLSSYENLIIEGIGTHFADSGFDRARTEAQLAEFRKLVDRLPQPNLIIHAANSAGAMHYPDAIFGMVRIGIGAYGIDPYGLFGGHGKPILQWKARVMSVRTRPAGTPVSYSGTHICSRETVIATLGVGYGDGYGRAQSNSGFVDIDGCRASIIGLVCMDQMLVDVTDIPGVTVGDEALLIGGEATVEELAKTGKTNVHEVITRIMSRVPRRYRYE